MGSSELKTARWQKLCARLKLTRPPVCWYCGEDIDMTVSGKHPRGWTLDHIVPRHAAPHLTWDESNLKPAHFSCNTTRGSKSQEVNTSQSWD